MREISVKDIISTVKNLCIDANYNLGEDVEKALKEGYQKEESPTSKETLNQIIENVQIAKQGEFPLCQDTGFAVVFVDMGDQVFVKDGNLFDAINEGVRQGYKEGYLRKSILGDPIERKNTGDNTPAVIHMNVVKGDKLKITVAPKGGGSENMSEVKMMKPSDGVEGVKEFVIDMVRRSGSNPCPPIIVGVGIGGTFEKCAEMAKRALLREVGERNPNPFYAKLEEELLEKVNKLGIGPQGFGGRVTALDVHIETFPCHIASFPAAVNIQCHAARHKEAVI
ncbi:MAG: fumarate hydratase [candidate division Zixibacteria bacterium RBG_16_43_9]|nr:MAG: fumarate hydratase [candidate division Zixibacteria bacterium RBG_16_43_9]